MNDLKEVYFKFYCDKCEHYEVDEVEDPCNECLTFGSNIDSHKPINYKPVEEVAEKVPYRNVSV